ncbi:HlyD family type I secretion periplasmic adaptor subunit [Marinomonas agarivorans]|nr:HlyD family type I secretion periplasmic adaptor subunit [Marinomonas agarivorans]
MNTEQELFGSVRRHLRLAAIFMGLLLFGMGGWTAITEVSGAVVATGTVVVESNVKQVQHQDGGVVQSIHVAVGDLVQTDDLLVVLDDTAVRAEWSSVIKQLNELYARHARLLAEQQQKTIDFSPYAWVYSDVEGVRQIQANQQSLFHARRNSLAGQKAQLNEQIAQLEQKIIGIEAESSAKQREIALVESELSDMQRLFDSNYVAKTQITTLERDHSQLQGAYSSLLAQIAQDREAISERRIQILQLEEDSRADILQQLQDADINITQLEQQKIVLEEQLSRLEIRASNTGFIHNLTVHTLGGVISPAEPIMAIVPQQDVLLVEAQVRPVDIEQLSPNQEARLRFPSFDQKKTPEIRAVLKTISADLLMDQTTGASYYQARFSIPETELAQLGDKQLIPGMPVEVFAKTEERTILSYLLKPISDQLAYAMRER